MRKLFYKRDLVPTPIPEAFVPNASGRLLWLQRLAHAILKRLGRHAMMDVTSVRQIELPESKNILDSIRDELRARINFNAFRHEDLVLIVGRDEWAEIDLLMIEHAQFYVGRGPEHVFGVPLCVSGWFNGFVILPRKALKI